MKQREQDNRYRTSDKGKERDRRYCNSPIGRLNRQLIEMTRNRVRY